MQPEHGHSAEIRNPGPLRLPSGLTVLFGAFALVGVILFAFGLSVDSKRAWYSFVQNHFFFMSLALGGIFFAAIQWMTSAMWSAPVRRIAESFAAFLPVSLITLLILYFGIHQIYVWSDMTHVRGDLVLEGKSGYLSPGFFMIRNIVFLLVMLAFAWKMIRNSLDQDETREYRLTLANRRLAPAFLILFGILFTMASFDQMMSVDPHWFSTMFGVYCFAGLFYAVLGAVAVVTVLLLRSGALEGIVNDNHLHDIGKFMFAFTVFWAYIGFSQFMLIWYANMPEETGFYLHRFHGGWFYLSVFLLVGKFLVPFFVLLPRDAKRDQKVLLSVGVFMLIAHWIDLYWVTQPEFSASGPRFSWIELGTTLGFLGIFGLVVTRFLSRHNIVAIGDPRLAESVLHHHQ